MTKRSDYISWDEYFMGVAMLSSMRSKDPNTQVGACIVNEDRKIVGVGYNGFPTGCCDDDLPWEREGEWIDTKYPYVCHVQRMCESHNTVRHQEDNLPFGQVCGNRRYKGKQEDAFRGRS